MTRKERAKELEKIEKHFSIKEICDMAGISRPTYYRIIAEKGVNLETLEKMELNLKKSKEILLSSIEKDFDIKLL